MMTSPPREGEPAGTGVLTKRVNRDGAPGVY